MIDDLELVTSADLNHGLTHLQVFTVVLVHCPLFVRLHHFQDLLWLAQQVIQADLLYVDVCLGLFVGVDPVHAASFLHRPRCKLAVLIDKAELAFLERVGDTLAEDWLHLTELGAHVTFDFTVDLLPQLVWLVLP